MSFLNSIWLNRPAIIHRCHFFKALFPHYFIVLSPQTKGDSFMSLKFDQRLGKSLSMKFTTQWIHLSFKLDNKGRLDLVKNNGVRHDVSNIIKTEHRQGNEKEEKGGFKSCRWLRPVAKNYINKVIKNAILMQVFGFQFLKGEKKK